MKVLDTQRTVEATGSIRSRTVGFSQEDMGEISRLLRDQIYTNKKLAAIRETICNAVDEHFKYGITTPVKVTIPTAADTNFYVRDYGLGLAEDNVFEIFFQYFASTKRKDLLSIGGFGIGSKSPFAVAQMMTVTSWFGGEKKVYVGVNTGGDCEAHLAHVEASNEPTGIEVTFDFGNAFSEARSVFLNFYKTFCLYSKLDIVGMDIGDSVYTEAKEIQTLIDKGWVINRSKFPVWEHARASVVLNKGILYNLPFTIKSNRTFALNVPENVRLDIHRSRETLEDTPHNRAVIQQLYDTTYATLQTDLLKEVPLGFVERGEYVTRHAGLIEMLDPYKVPPTLRPVRFEVRLDTIPSSNYYVKLRADGNYQTTNARFYTVRIDPSIRIYRLASAPTSSLIRGLILEHPSFHVDRYNSSYLTVCDDAAWQAIKDALEKASAGSSVVLIDATKVVPVIRPRQPRGPVPDNTYVNYFTGKRKTFSPEDLVYYIVSDQSKSDGGNGKYITPKNYDVSKLDEVLNKIAGRVKGKGFNTPVAVIPKSKVKSISPNWVPIWSLVKNARRHAYKAIDWSARFYKTPNIGRINSNIAARLLPTMSKVGAPKWPFEPKNIHPSNEANEHNNKVDKIEKMVDNSVEVRAMNFYWNHADSTEKEQIIAQLIKKL